MSVSTIETVLVAQSDDHLAAVERAKREGTPLESIGSSGSNVVPLDVATAIAEAKAVDHTYVGRHGVTYAEHLQDYHEVVRENPSYIALSNEEKAQQHHEYSAKLVREQAALNKRVEALIAEGFDITLAIQQANLERAQEHEGYAAEFERNRREREASATPVLDMVDETVKLVNSDKISATASLDERVSEMVKLTSVVVPDAMETSTKDALVTKDQIISVEKQYKDFVADAETNEARDYPGAVILASVSSPEELEALTVDAQIAAGRLHEDSLAVREGMPVKE